MIPLWDSFREDFFALWMVIVRKDEIALLNTTSVDNEARTR